MLAFLKTSLAVTNLYISKVGAREYMRYQILKKHSTKAERIVYEVLKELHIPFKHRWLIRGREVDFIIGRIALEIDGHEQDGEKNRMLAELGYIPLHLNNSEITPATIKHLLQNDNY